MEINNEKLEQFRSSGRPAMMKDIAEIAGCALSAVSTALNKSKSSTGVSASTREKILKVAELVNYRPNHAARSLVSRKSMTLGVCTSKAGQSFSPFYEAGIFAGIYNAATKAGYDVLLLDIIHSCQKITENRIDGIVLLSSHYTGDVIDKLADTTQNIVAIDHKPSEKIECVLFDNPRAIELIIEHLYSLGHRRIGFAGPCHENPLPDVLARKKAFIACQKKYDLLGGDDMVFDSALHGCIGNEAGYCRLEGNKATEYFLSLGEGTPTAIVAYNDVVASEVITTCVENGVSVPGQISVIGIDNADICDFTRPGLTSINHPMKEMGTKAIERLVEIMTQSADKQRNAADMIIQPELVIRESTAATA